MSLSRAMFALWHRAPVWRWSVIGAATETALTVASGLSGLSASSVPNGGGGNTGPNSAVFGSNSSANLSSPSKSCGPATVQALQAPLVMTQGGQTPTNVTTLGGSGPPSPSIEPNARFARFDSVVEAARRELRIGERCVKMGNAIDLLEKDDFAWADCFVDGAVKLAEAQACRGDLAASEVRFDRLIGAHDAAISDESAAFVVRLADARATMNPAFDSTRERWAAETDALRAGDAAIERIAMANQKIAALDNTASAASLQDPMAIAALADAGRQIGPLERGMMTSAQQANLQSASDASERLSASDNRLAALSAALAASNSTDPAARDALIDAVSRLEAFDTLRATPDLAAKISEARVSATTYALDDLVRAAANFDPDTAPPATFERLRDLRALAMGRNGDVPLNPQQTAAIETAGVANAHLKQSDQRLTVQHKTSEAVRLGGPAAIGSEVLRVVDAITAFDEARMDANSRDDYATLRAARGVAVAIEQRILTREVPLFVTSSSDSTVTTQAVAALRDRLRSNGFRLVAALEESAVTLSLSPGEPVRKSVVIGTSRTETAEIRIGLRASWTFAGDEFPMVETSGDGFGGNPIAAIHDAIDEAIAGLAVEIDKMAVKQ